MKNKYLHCSVRTVLTGAAYNEARSEPFDTVTHRGETNCFKVTVHVPVVLSESGGGWKGIREGEREGKGEIGRAHV